MKGVLILNWYWFGRDAVLLDFQTEDEKLPWETAAEDARKTFLCGHSRFTPYAGETVQTNYVLPLQQVIKMHGLL